MVAEKDQPQRPQLENPGHSTKQISLPKQDQTLHSGIPPHSQNPAKINPAINKHSNSPRRYSHRPPSVINHDITENLDHYASYTSQLGNPDFGKDSNIIASATLQAVTEASAAVKKQSILVSHTFTNSSSSPERQFEQNNADSINTLPSHAVRTKLNTFRQRNQNMELHDASGTLLQPYGVNGDTDQQQAQPQQAQQPQQVSQQQQQLQNAALPQSSKQDQHPQQQQNQQGQAQPHPQQVQGRPASAGVGQASSSQAAGASGASSGAQQTAQQTVPKKPARMPGTKQCPSCQNTIAAAVAKCPKCPHVFREKKEKVKRSGKRGKKNCPKCNYENPSACSSCKSCKHVFRLKLMDKYKAMRPRQTNESAAAAAAAAAHAAANMAHGQGAVTAVSTVPLPAGVAAYPNQMSQPMHHVSVMPPLAGQHPMAMHQHTHNVHTAGVPQMHPMPQHPMQHHQTHPQL